MPFLQIYNPLIGDIVTKYYCDKLAPYIITHAREEGLRVIVLTR
jgi:hypothetical protein